MTVIIILFGKNFLSFFTDDLNLISMAYQYSVISVIGSLSIFLSIKFERVFQATGNTIFDLYTMIIGGIIRSYINKWFRTST